MPLHKLTFKRSEKFPYGVVASKLLDEIAAEPGIRKTCLKVYEIHDNAVVKLKFSDTLTSGELTALDGVCAAHNPSELQVSALADKQNAANSIGPGATDDETDGNFVGQIWVDVDADQVYLCMDATETAALWKRLTYSWFNAYHAAGNISLIESYTPISWDTEVRKDAAFTHAADSADITINATTDIVVCVDVGVNMTSGSARCDAVARLMLDTGSGFAEVPGAKTYMYSRIAAQGKSSGSIHRILSINSGDKIRVEASRNSGSGSIATDANTCRILIQTI